MNRDERIVVVGAGLTGLRAAERLRELKFDGEVIILGDERLPPYHRPALSKQLLMGTLRPSDLTLPAYEDIGAKWRFGTQVRHLLPRNRTLQLPGGEEITYDGLVLATGVEARRPNNIPYHDPRVLVLRTLPDAMDLERVINSTKGRVAVVGGGFTGCEIAASLRHMSREVTLIGRADNLLGNVLGAELGGWLTNLHRDHGVDLALGNSVRDWAPVTDGIGLRLTDGSTMLASCVVVAAGTVPTTGWLRGSGLPLDNGVVCDPTCHVVGADDIVAAGDVAQWPNLRFDNEPRRVEHWLNAIEMGRAAAESLMAGRTAAEPFTPMPRFWTEQYGVRIQAAGMPKLGADVISLGKPDEGTGTVYGYSREGRLMGVVGLDCPSSVLAWTESVSRQNPVPRQRTIAAASAPKQITAGPQEPVAPPKRRSAGRHQLPVKDKQQVPRRAEIRQHDIGYVDTPTDPTPMETSGPLRQIDGEVAGPAEASGPLPRVGSVSGPLPRVGGASSPARRGGSVSGPLPRVGGSGGLSGPLPRVGDSGLVPRVGAAGADPRGGGMPSGPLPRVDGAAAWGGDVEATFVGDPVAGSGPLPRVDGAGPVGSADGAESGPLPVRPTPPGWGRPVQMTGPVPPVPAMPPGRAKNVVDSFSRMLPVSVRPPARRAGNRPPTVPQSGYLGSGAQPGHHGPDGGSGRSEHMAPADRHPPFQPPTQPPTRSPAPRRPVAPPPPPAFGGYAEPRAPRHDAVRPPAFHEHGGPRPVTGRAAGQVRPPVFGGREEMPSGMPPRGGDVAPPSFRAAGTSTDQLRFPAPIAGRLDPTDVRPVELTSQLPVIRDEPANQRRPRHARPDDYGYEPPRQRPGPEDSYDRIPAVHGAGGRRRREEGRRRRA